jgi:hypothetical protein
MFSVWSAMCLGTMAAGDSIQGSYVEARAVPCSAGTDSKTESCQTPRAVLAWQVRQGVYAGEKLDGQTIIAVVTGEPSPGTLFGQTKTVFFIESRVTAPQERALVQLAKDLSPEVIHDAGKVVRSRVDVRIAEGCGCGAAVVECDLAKFRTRRQTDDEQTAACNSNPAKPLAEVFSSTPAVTTEYAFEGEALSAAQAVTVFTGSFSR